MSTGRLSAFIRRLRGDIDAARSGGLSDAQLLDRWLAQRDQAAFEVLLWRHGPMILGVCRRVLRNDADVEDAFQAAFLLLVRKAAAIRRRDSVAAWLYQTAYRVALRARDHANKRNARETAGVEYLGADDSDAGLWHDVRPILDDEINRLPEKYRIPFVRCHLEGCTNEEAAIEMGCPVGTIHSRLAWARERLRSRLTRRGVTLAGAGLTALLAHKTATAGLPAALAESTLQAAFAYAAHSATAGVSAGAVALTKGVLRTMFIAKLKIAAAVVLAIALGSGVGGMTYYRMMEATACPPRGVSSSPGVPLPAPTTEPTAPAPRTIRVPSEADGKVVFLATEVTPGEIVPANKKVEAKCWMVAISDKNVPPEEQVIVENQEKGTVYRKWLVTDDLPPGRLRVGYVLKTYRKLRQGDSVKQGQLLGLIDAELALDELRSKLAKIEVADSELQTSVATKQEAKSRLDKMEQANLRTPGTFAPEEVNGARLTYTRYVQEEIAKRASLTFAQREASAARMLLKKHEIYAPVSGAIKTIHVQQGEAVKYLETVLEILPRDDDK